MLCLGQFRCSSVELVNKTQWFHSILPLAWLNFCFTGFHLPDAFMLCHRVMVIHGYTVCVHPLCGRLGWGTMPVADPNAIDCGGRSDCSGPLVWTDHCSFARSFCLHEVPAFGWVKSDSLTQVILVGFSPRKLYFPRTSHLLLHLRCYGTDNINFNTNIHESVFIPRTDCLVQL